MINREKPSSEREFGLVFATFFAAIALWPAITRGGLPRWWALGLAVVFLALGLAKSRLLRPLHWVWFRFGLLLHNVVNPIILALIFFAAIVPMGLLKRTMHRRALGLDRKLETYWIIRETPAPKPNSMAKQF